MLEHRKVCVGGGRHRGLAWRGAGRGAPSGMTRCAVPRGLWSLNPTRYGEMDEIFAQRATKSSVYHVGQLFLKKISFE